MDQDTAGSSFKVLYQTPTYGRPVAPPQKLSNISERDFRFTTNATKIIIKQTRCGQVAFVFRELGLTNKSNDDLFWFCYLVACRSD